VTGVQTCALPISLYTQPPEEWLRIPVPALVSPELFASVQEQLADNRERQRALLAGARYLLQGLLVCQTCGYALCGRSVKQKRRYYSCLGRDGRRFGGRRVCHVRPLRCADLDTAVWDDVGRLLLHPHKLQEEHQRRLSSSPEGKSAPGLQSAIDKVKSTLQRLIDSYAGGLLTTEEFEPRVRRAREHLARLETEAQLQADREAAQQELKVLVSRLQDFADHVRAGLRDTTWQQQRELIRTLVKRIEVGEASIRLVYRVNLPPFAKSPKGGLCQDCSQRQRAWRAVSANS